MKTQKGSKGRDIAILNEVIKEGPPKEGKWTKAVTQTSGVETFQEREELVQRPWSRSMPGICTEWIWGQCFWIGEQSKAIQAEVKKVMVWCCKGLGKGCKACKASQPLQRPWLCSKKEEREMLEDLYFLGKDKCVHVCSVVSKSLRSYGLWPTRLLFHGIFQARILELIAISYSRGSSWPWD